jgi:5-methylthioadenosine/S-adenosylhomocysteine deaminase
MRGICGQTVLKFPSPDARSYEESLDQCREFIIKWKNHPLIIPAVAPHAPYTCTAEILSACAQLAVEYDVPLHIHLSETRNEIVEHRKQYGMPVIPWVKKQNLFDAKVIAAHCVHIDDGEIRTLFNHHAGVAHNPSSNLKLASGIAPIAQLLAAGVHVGIGTDGPASNNDLDMLEEIRLAAFLAKTATDNPTTLPARQVFAMATCIGAKALHIDHLVGAIEPGKQADLFVIDLQNLHNWPHFSHDPEAIYSRIVYAAKSTDIQDVMCNGKWLMRSQQLTSIDVEPIMQEAAQVAAEIDRFLIAREGDILSKLLALGELQQEESFEVQVKAKSASIKMLDKLLAHPRVMLVRTSHYQQHDTYFEFSKPAVCRLRYREDEYLDDDGNVHQTRVRLTFTEAGIEREFTDAVLLSRARFIAPARHTLRFYTEYFRPDTERTVVKERQRWHIEYDGMLFYVNLDRLTSQSTNNEYLEIKSRTWSLKDAEQKAAAITKLLEIAEINQSALIKEEYLAMNL